MEYSKALKDKTAKRLKELRNNFRGEGLSHERLSEMLSRTYYKTAGGEILRREAVTEIDFEYEDIISVAVLKNYELTPDRDVSENRIKAGYGMSISYLVMFADFYGVSVDYLLGISDFPVADLDKQIINRVTGLSSDAIQTLESLHRKKHEQFTSNLIEQPKFYQLIEMLSDIDNQQNQYNKNLKQFVNTMNQAKTKYALIELFDIYKQEFLFIINNNDPSATKRSISIAEYIRFLRFELEQRFSHLVDDIIGDNLYDTKSFFSKALELLDPGCKQYEEKKDALIHCINGDVQEVFRK